ncbi:MAG: ribonuclease R [Ignavibacteriae bacterium]|nr:ribonuclease R [Ignavibacteria bacterium]MBI3364895.1 ribonuclease R [Ignavibacteriota bacterium]
MTNSTLTDVRERVLHFLAKHPNEQFKPKVLAHRLAITGQEDYRTLQRVLNELFQANEITRGKRKRYGHGIPPVASRMAGVVDVQKNGYGLVRLLPPEKGTIVVPARFMKTALDGDTVSVALFATTKRQDKQRDDMPEGEIVEVIERSQQPIVGVFSKSKNFFFVVPDSRSADRDIYIPPGKTKGARPGEKVVAQVDDWESRNLNPEGHIIEVLGKAGEVSAEMTAVAREFQLSLRFPKEVLQESERINESIPKEEYDKRSDLRELPCFTIDPEDAKDFDDAVSLELLGDGSLRLGVHIADVSHYVKEGSALDREALKRGTSVYLANEVIPMLPEKLSNNLCSLRPREDRLAYTAFMTVTPRGVVKDYQIEKSVIHSKRRFTYEEVQKIIETGRGDFAGAIKQMHKLSRTLLTKRLKNGALDFETAETKFRFDEHGKPTEIIKKVRLDAHRLVEEFMLLANQTVARHIAVPKKETDIHPFVYRIHDSPPPEKLADLASFVEHLGYSLNMNGGSVTSRALQKLLNDVKGKDEESVINEVAIRSMAKAIYSETNIGHFGLAFDYYTHFTSPIRRYPDLIVHRLLFEYLHRMPHKRREQLVGVLPEICETASERERVAQEAERASVKVMQVEYMKRHIGDEFHAIISGVTNFGLFVKITDLLVEGLIHVRDMGDDFYTFDEKKYVLIGRRDKKRFRLGDKVDIRVVRVDPEERKIDFRLAERKDNIDSKRSRK